LAVLADPKATPTRPQSRRKRPSSGPAPIADEIAAALRDSDGQAERGRQLVRLAEANGQVTVTAEKTLELAKQAEVLYKTQDPAEQRRLLENAAFELHL
jgi:hypothetical protein